MCPVTEGARSPLYRNLILDWLVIGQCRPLLSGIRHSSFWHSYTQRVKIPSRSAGLRGTGSNILYIIELTIHAHCTFTLLGLASFRRTEQHTGSVFAIVNADTRRLYQTNIGPSSVPVDRTARFPALWSSSIFSRWTSTALCRRGPTAGHAALGNIHPLPCYLLNQGRDRRTGKAAIESCWQDDPNQYLTFSLKGHEQGQVRGIGFRLSTAEFGLSAAPKTTMKCSVLKRKYTVYVWRLK